MFSIDKMTPASEWYCLSQVRYYLGARARRKLKKRRSRRAGDDGDPDDEFGPDPDDSLFGDATPYTIETVGEPPGQWWGLGASALGLSGMVQEEQYHRVFKGFHPFTEEPLVQNAGLATRRAGSEGCFSVPKDVSVLVSQMLSADREPLQKAIWQSAEDGLRLIQERFAFSRVGKASEGCRYVPVGLVVPMFEHASARPTPNHPPDPDHHIHAQPLNLAVDEFGHWRSIEPAPIFKNQVLITAYWRAALAARLWSDFGLITEAKRNGFTIRGVPEELVKLYSKRRKAILDYLAEKSQTGGAAAAKAALATREKKDPLVSRKSLFDQWQKTNAAAGFGGVLAQALLVFLHECLGGLQRTVRRMMREPQRERLCRVLANERDGFIVERLREVTPVVRHGGIVAEQVPFPVVLSAVGKAEEEVEPASVRQVVRRIRAIMPFADERRRIARVTEVVAKSFLRQIKPVEPAIARHINSARAMIEASREVSRAGWRAERRRRVMIGEPNSSLRQPIDRGRVDHRIAIAAQVAPAEIIGNDEQDVGRLRGSSVQRGQRREQQGS